MPQRFGPVGPLLGEAPPQRVAREPDFAGREKPFHPLHPTPGIWQGAFIERMDRAYAAADLVVSRSGAGTVSELCLVAKPVLFVR